MNPKGFMREGGGADVKGGASMVKGRGFKTARPCEGQDTEYLPTQPPRELGPHAGCLSLHSIQTVACVSGGAMSALICVLAHERAHGNAEP